MSCSTIQSVVLVKAARADWDGGHGQATAHADLYPYLSGRWPRTTGHPLEYYTQSEQ